eukprot:1143563-Pelagomonas_calceolata.AAC.1
MDSARHINKDNGSIIIMDSARHINKDNVQGHLVVHFEFLRLRALSQERSLTAFPLMSLHRSACCRCAVSDCCQALCLHRGRRRGRSGFGMVGGSQYSIRTAWCEIRKKERLRLPSPAKARGDLEVVLSVIISYVRVYQHCFFPGAFTKSFDASSNIVAFSFHGADDVILAALEHEECAV